MLGARVPVGERDHVHRLREIVHLFADAKILDGRDFTLDGRNVYYASFWNLDKTRVRTVCCPKDAGLDAKKLEERDCSRTA